jgi:hypothetical protein
MSFRVSFPCTSEEQVGSVIERVLALHGYSVEVYRGESHHPPYEFLGINGSKVVKKPYGKYRFMVYFTITRQGYCEVESSSLIDTLEEYIQDEPIDVYIRITSGVYYEINNELNIMYREILDAIRHL